MQHILDWGGLPALLQYPAEDQTVHLPAWAGNPSVRLIKAPKLIWIDAGVQRALSGEVGGLRGEQYENAIIAQILITLWSRGVRMDASYLRTVGGLEVDLLLERQEGLIGLELKARPRRPDSSERGGSSEIGIAGDSSCIAVTRLYS